MLKKFCSAAVLAVLCLVYATAGAYAENITVSEVGADGSISVYGELPEYKYGKIGLLILDTDAVVPEEIYNGYPDGKQHVRYIAQSAADKNGRYSFKYMPLTPSEKEVAYIITDYDGTVAVKEFSSVFTPVPSQLVISGKNEILIPAEGGEESVFTVRVVDQRGDLYEGEYALTWSTDAWMENVSIDPATGVLTVGNGAEPGIINITAQCEGLSASMQVELCSDIGELLLSEMDGNNRMLLSGRISTGAYRRITAVTVPTNIWKNGKTVHYDFDSLEEAKSLMGESFNENICYITETTSGEYGRFSMPVVIFEHSNTTSGEYKTFVSSNSVDKQRQVCFSFASEADKDKLIRELNAAQSSADIKATVENYIIALDAMGVMTDEYNAFDETARADAARILLGYRSGAFTYDNTAECANKAIAAAALNAARHGGVGSLLNVCEKFEEILGISLGENSDYTAIPESKRNDIMTALLKKLPTDSAEAFVTEYRTLISVPLVNATVLAKMEDVLKRYSDIFGIKTDSKIEREILKAMVGRNFGSIQAVKEAYNTAAEGAKKDSTPQKVGGGGGGGGVASGVPSVIPDEPGKNDGEVTFSDISDAEWAGESIINLAARGILSGYENGEFRPNELITREQFIKILVSAFYPEEAAGESGFDDVVPGSWYEKYISAAEKTGLAKGIGENIFGVGMPVSRQDMAVFIYRVVKNKNIEMPDGEVKEFADGGQIGEYARESVSKMSGFGVISGIDGEFRPLENATRAQVARVVYLLTEYIK